jgi:hypothetical protein
MATELACFEHSWPAVRDLSSYQHRIMKLSSGQIDFATAATDVLLGVIQDKPAAAGRAGCVRIYGISKVEAGDAVLENALVTSDNVGRGVTAAAGAGTNNYIIGRALTAAGAAGDKFNVLLYPQIYQGA